MKLFSTTLSAIKKNRIEFSISWIICLIALFFLTSLSVLKAVLTQLDSTNQFQLFTTKQINELQQYFSERLTACGIGLFFLLLIIFTIRLQVRRKANVSISTRQLIYSTALEFFLGLIVAAICLTLLFTLFEPVYESALQSFYHQGLNQFKELPSYVLSNGTSGIAYSVRSVLAFELSSTTLLDLFFSSLLKSVSFIFLCLCVLIIGSQLLTFPPKKKNVR